MSISLVICRATTTLATSIVAIRTPELFVIAADTAGTFKGGAKSDMMRQVSKIFEKSGFLHASSGLNKDPMRGFDVEATVGSCLRPSQRFRAAVKCLESTLSRSLGEELMKLRREEPALFRYSIEGPSAGTAVLLASYEEGQPIAIAIRFLGQVTSDGKILIQTDRLACPGNCPNGTYTFFLGHRQAIDKHVAEHGTHLSMPPEESVRFMVQLEIDANTPGVAPPIDVARLDKAGVKWISRQGRDVTQ